MVLVAASTMTEKRPASAAATNQSLPRDEPLHTDAKRARRNARHQQTERLRRSRLNRSFKELHDVLGLPPGTERAILLEHAVRILQIVSKHPSLQHLTSPPQGPGAVLSSPPLASPSSSPADFLATLMAQSSTPELHLASVQSHPQSSQPVAHSQPFAHSSPTSFASHLSYDAQPPLPSIDTVPQQPHHRATPHQASHVSQTPQLQQQQASIATPHLSACLPPTIQQGIDAILLASSQASTHTSRLHVANDSHSNVSVMTASGYLPVPGSRISLLSAQEDDSPSGADQNLVALAPHLSTDAQVPGQEEGQWQFTATSWTLPEAVSQRLDQLTSAQGRQYRLEPTKPLSQAQEYLPCTSTDHLSASAWSSSTSTDLLNLERGHPHPPHALNSNLHSTLENHLTPQSFRTISRGFQLLSADQTLIDLLGTTWDQLTKADGFMPYFVQEDFKVSSDQLALLNSGRAHTMRGLHRMRCRSGGYKWTYFCCRFEQASDNQFLSHTTTTLVPAPANNVAFYEVFG